ncbi:MAG: radical SAM protein [Candidatus Riflebacteria bacterium]|nr:radical SAM protein [Candidatus Riflebacteria bacterium]
MVNDWGRRLRRWWSRLIADWRGGTTVLLEIVRECNQRCAYCYRLPDSRGPARRLAPAELDTVLERLTTHFGRLRLTITGGEPTLHPDLEAMVRRCVAVDPAATLITNLSTMTPALAGRLRAAGLRGIQVTFLSPVPAEHEALCGAGSFDRWLAGLTHAREAGLEVGAILLVTRPTARRVPESLRFLLGLGLGSFLVNRYNGGFPAKGGGEPPGPAPQQAPSRPATDDGLSTTDVPARGGDGPAPAAADPLPAAADPAGLFLTGGDLDRFLADLEEAGARWNLTIPLGVPIPSCLADLSRYPHLEFSACPIGRDRGMYWAVGADGALRACNHLPGSLGDLLTTPVADILRGEPWQRLRQELATVPAPCRGCPTFDRCRGGCRGAAATWAGSAAGLDPWVERVLAGRDREGPPG